MAHSCSVRIWLAAVFLVSGCVTVEPNPKSNELLPEPQFVAKTFWYSNKNAAPEAWMLRAAARSCGTSEGENLQRIGPYGLAGSWFLEFSCATAGHTKRD